ncbi:hypothetical protein Glove_319g56 [Diversispora epigaea]|uniref:Uncharacterized protein n=1 Tax=Diversispora epigaea TaxID=1348612 RepID=A0A397HV10_9GLOM|nr:hypothetical protein Glove_319g56 [Diversispora epigaea]
MIGDYRIRLEVQKLEGMFKIQSYYLTNIKKELKYYSKELNIDDLKEITNDSTVDLSLSIFDDNVFNDNINVSNTNNENNVNTPNFNYDPEALVNAFIEEENNV